MSVFEELTARVGNSSEKDYRTPNLPSMCSVRRRNGKIKQHPFTIGPDPLQRSSTTMRLPHISPFTRRSCSLPSTHSKAPLASSTLSQCCLSPQHFNSSTESTITLPPSPLTIQSLLVVVSEVKATRVQLFLFILQSAQRFLNRVGDSASLGGTTFP